MSLKIRFRFDGRCRVHPRYNPERDGSPEHKDCSGCESLRAIQLYTSIALKKARNGEGLIVSSPEALASLGAGETVAQNPDPDAELPEREAENSPAQNSD